jgi:hypothetical protein
MHTEQRAFCERVKNLFPGKFIDQDVLEIGSQNINGSVRELFTGGKYLGIDLGPGKDVDLVCHGKDYYRDTPFDVIVSCESLEHDEFYAETNVNAIRLLKGGGLLLMTMASYGRPAHGTHNSAPFASPHTLNYYGNVCLKDVVHLCEWEQHFFPFAFEYGGMSDLYFYGIKRS